MALPGGHPDSLATLHPKPPMLDSGRMSVDGLRPLSVCRLLAVNAFVKVHAESGVEHVQWRYAHLNVS